MYSRIAMVILLVGMMTLGAVVHGEAQEAPASAANLFADLGLPEITLTATAAGLALSQSEVPAGRYLVTLDNQSEDPYLYVDIARLAEHVSTESTSCPTLFPPECFSWYADTVLPGGVSGESPQAVIELTAGEFGLWGPGEPTIEPAAILTVTGNPDAAIDGPMPATTGIFVTKGEGGFGIAIHVEGELRPRPQLVRIINAADQPLYIAAAQDPESYIGDGVASTPVLAASRDTSPLDAFNDTQFGRMTYSEKQSENTTQWVALDLVSGPIYLAAYLVDPLSSEDYYGWYAATATVLPVAKG